MNGKGRAIENVMIERLWRTVKYEEIYLKEYRSGTDLHKGLQTYFQHYTSVRKHTSLDRQTPAEVYRAGQIKYDIACI
jgi:putative transposase